MPETATHADILAAVNKCQNDIGVMLLDMQGLKTAVNQLKEVIGAEKEDEHGVLIGTGLVGRHVRLASRVDKRFRSFDDWRNYAIGAIAAAGLMLGAIWWLVEQRLAQVLR